jgi:hypothetical protein
MKAFALISVISISILVFAGLAPTPAQAAPGAPVSCAKVAIGAAYTTLMRQLPNQWHLSGVKVIQPGAFEISLHNDEDGDYSYVAVTKLDPQTGICHVMAVKQD